MPPASQPLSSAPVFVMGSHRSGTTWLQQLVADTGAFDFLSAYHVIRYADLPGQPRAMEEAPAYRETCALFDRLGLDGRVIDEVAVSPAMPEEYGFVLANAGTGFTVTPRNAPLLRELCERIQRAPGRPVVLKNPWDYPNFLAIKAAIPGARFVFIHRHPERVLHSSLKAIRAVHATHTPYLELLYPAYGRLFGQGPVARLGHALQGLTITERFGVGVRFAARRLAAGHRYYLENVERIPAADRIAIRYEDLCDRPAEVFGQVLAFLGVDAAEAARLRMQPRPRQGAVLPEVGARRDAIARQMAPYMKRHGYAPGGVVLPLS